MTSRTTNRALRRLAAATALSFGLAACEGGLELPFGAAGSGASEPRNTPAGATLVEHDVEAPEVFHVTEPGLWDGRPSLGGVWVAHPDATDPERVIIRNEANGQTVIGALFRREREFPGPRLQISSDAAAALNLVAGAPTQLTVTALRREEVAEPVAETEDSAETGETAATAAGAEEATAGAADAAPEPPPMRPQPSNLHRPYIQVGTFSDEESARNIGEALRTAGLVPVIEEQTGEGQPFWRVLVGPARTRAERTRLMEIVQDLGFEDAYFVTE